MSTNKYKLKVNKSLRHVYAFILDNDHNILASASTLSLKVFTS